MQSEPCSEWAELLVSTHPDDLPPEMRATLHQHLLTCPTCQSAWDIDQLIDGALRQALWRDMKREDGVQKSLPPYLLHLWQWSDTQQ